MTPRDFKCLWATVCHSFEKGVLQNSGGMWKGSRIPLMCCLGAAWVMPYLLYGSRVLPFYMTTRVSGLVSRNCRYLMTIPKWRKFRSQLLLKSTGQRVVNLNTRSRRWWNTIQASTSWRRPSVGWSGSRAICKRRVLGWRVQCRFLKWRQQRIWSSSLCSTRLTTLK